MSHRSRSYVRISSRSSVDKDLAMSEMGRKHHYDIINVCTYSTSLVALKAHVCINLNFCSKPEKPFGYIEGKGCMMHTHLPLETDAEVSSLCYRFCISFQDYIVPFARGQKL